MTAPGPGPGVITRRQLRPQFVPDSARSVPGPDCAYVVRPSPTDASPMNPTPTSEWNNVHMLIATQHGTNDPTYRGNKIPSDIRNFQGNGNLTMSDGTDWSSMAEEKLEARHPFGPMQPIANTTVLPG
jgi:hypothetical protein